MISLGELVLGRNPILRLQFTRLQLVQDLVFDLQISRLSHFFMQILSLHYFCENWIIGQYKYHASTHHTFTMAATSLPPEADSRQNL